MSKKVNLFRKGQIAHCGTNCVLVTGPGKKDEGYPVFSGVVIMAIKREDEDTWSLGMYSETWSSEAFKKVDIDLSKMVAGSLGIKP